MNAESLRNGWDAVLEAVKKRRRVSWILLSSVTVRSLEAGALTLEFPREGELKTFSTSGHDAVLSDVLNELYGVKLRIVAVPVARTQPESPGLAASRADLVTERVAGGPGAASAAGPGGGRGSGPLGGPPDGAGDGAGDSAGDSAGDGTGGGAAAGADEPGGSAGAPGTGEPGSGAGAPGNHGAAGPRRPNASGGDGAPGSGAPGSRARGWAGGQPPPAVRLDTPPADDEADPRGDADADAEVTGMELIQRELGGQIIGEIEDS